MNDSEQFSFHVVSDDSFSMELEGFDLDMADTGYIEPKISSTKEDLFDFMYSITPLGINFNVILKEDTETIKNILSLVLSHIEDRGRIKEFFRECDIFIAHMENRLQTMYDAEHTMYDVASDIYLKFKENLNFLRSKLRVYNYSGVTLDGDSDNFNNLIRNDGDDQFTFDVYSLTQYETQNRIRSEIATYKHVDLNNSPIFLYCNEFDSLLTANENISDLLIFVKQMLNVNSSAHLQPLDKTLLNGETGKFASKSPTYKRILLNMLEYTGKSYEYDNSEIEVMELLGFPTEICNREQFLKPNIEQIIKDKANKTKLVYDDKNYDMRNHQRSKEVLLWLKKAKVYIENKGNRADMGALYF